MHSAVPRGLRLLTLGKQGLGSCGGAIAGGLRRGRSSFATAAVAALRLNLCKTVAVNSAGQDDDEVRREVEEVLASTHALFVVECAWALSWGRGRRVPLDRRSRDAGLGHGHGHGRHVPRRSAQHPDLSHNLYIRTGACRGWFCPPSFKARLESRAELPGMRRICWVQLWRAATRREALSTTWVRVKAASLSDDALLMPPALPLIESSACGRVRAEAPLNNLPPAAWERLHELRWLGSGARRAAR